MFKYFFVAAILANAALLAKTSRHESSESSEEDCDGDNEPITTPESTTPICNEYAVYSTCINGGCGPKNCSEIDDPIKCVKIKESACIKGCICKEGYLRAADGNCVPKKKCPKKRGCGEDPNAVRGCGVNCGKRCSDYEKRPFILCPSESSYCPGGCDCPGDLVLDENTGKCVPFKDCTPVCEENEVYSTCINGGCGPKNCSEIDDPIKCVNIKESACIKGCICKEGYLRAADGNCVPKKECPKKPATCGKNEILDPCANGGCGRRNCSQIGTPKLCIDRIKCEPGCVCKEGFYRNTKDECVIKEECDICDYDPNKVPGCGNNCGRKCSDYNQIPIICPNECSDNGCECRGDLVLDEETNECVPPEKCTITTVCGPNEKFSNSSNSVNQNCADIGTSIQSQKSDSCKPGCVCKDGLYRDSHGNCVPQNECDICANDVNQVPGCGVYCNQRCSDVGKPDGACILICKLNSCDCKKGFYLNDDGLCVPPEQCPPTCKENEIYSTCINGGCGPKNCSEIDDPIKCVKIAASACIKGCICKEGYLRAADGNCVPKKKCPKKPPTCKENEIYSTCINGGCGPKNCSEIDDPIKCVKIAASECIKGCICKEGYLRAADGNCVPKKKCPKKPPTCKENEIYSTCINGGCGPKNCSEIDDPIKCVKIKESACIKGCICKEGYLRAADGNCVPKKKCPKKPPVCKENEVYSTCINGGCGPKNCSEIDDPVKCVRIADSACIKGCICKEGYLRAADGNCVPKKKCPKKPPTCGKNEILDPCSNGYCGRRNCSQIGTPILCVDPIKCEPGCVCKEDFYRNTKGECVSKQECDICDYDPNKVPGCGNNCGRKCSDYNQIPIICPKQCSDNGCDCKGDLVLDEATNECVPPEKCTPQCGENEVHSSCSNAICGYENCTDIGGPEYCIRLDPAYCKPGCVCKQDYLRDSNRKCVLKEDCDICNNDPHSTPGCGVNCGRRCSEYLSGHPEPCKRICYPNACDCKDGFYWNNNTLICVPPEHCSTTTMCGPNEKYSNCSNSVNQNCADIGTSIQSQKSDSCKPGCVCKDGLYRDSHGNCVPQNECDICANDVNQVPGCGVYCNQRCSDVGKPVRPCILICRLNACDCKKGFYLNDDGLCVAPEQCPPQCGENEVLSSCSNAICGYENCTDIGGPEYCFDFDSAYCKPGCVCKPDYLRDSNRKCVLKKDCDICNNDPNSTPGCGVNCGRRCSEYLSGHPEPCKEICYPNGCDCKDGFYWNNNTLTCVPPEHCSTNPPEQCGANEEYSNCSNQICGPQKCADIGLDYTCLDVKENECTGGCICKKDHYRDAKGNCVPKDQCDSCAHDPNKVPGCDDQRCGGFEGDPKFCTAACHNKCQCREGYHLDNVTGLCVEECAPNCTGQNEVPHNCINAVCRAQNCSQRFQPVECPDVKKCIKGCVCDEGFLKDPKGNCIPEDKCPLPECHGKFEQWQACPSCIPQDCYPEKHNDTVCPTVCIGSCRCIKGYVRGDNGECMPEDQCPSHVCTGKNEEYVECPDCSPQTCSTRDKVFHCPKSNSTGACRCIKDHFRNNKNECVSRKECEALEECPKGEVYEPCPAVRCDADYCPVSRDYPTRCPVGIVCDPPRCVCEKGKVRDRRHNNTCIPITDCDPFPCDGENEVFKKCPSRCQKLTCKDFYNNVDCSNCDETEDKGVCLPACVCKEGLYRDDNNDCVIPKACLQPAILPAPEDS